MRHRLRKKYLSKLVLVSQKSNLRRHLIPLPNYQTGVCRVITVTDSVRYPAKGWKKVVTSEFTISCKEQSCSPRAQPNTETVSQEICGTFTSGWRPQATLSDFEMDFILKLALLWLDGWTRWCHCQPRLFCDFNICVPWQLTVTSHWLYMLGCC